MHVSSYMTSGVGVERRGFLRACGALAAVTALPTTGWADRLERVAKIGFHEVEVFDFYRNKPNVVSGWLETAGLVSSFSHVFLGTLRDPERRKEAIEAAKTIGNDYLVCVWIELEDRQSLDDYRPIADVLNEAGESCSAGGLTLAYHNHDFEFVPMEGALPFDLLLQRTDEERVVVEIDLYWITKAGADPFQYFAQYPGRFPLVHVKDMDDTEARHFTEVGTGVIDFKTIFGRMDGTGARHFYIEQDESRLDPFEAARIGYEYLKSLEF